jgi:hypothetical protein
LRGWYQRHRPSDHYHDILVETLQGFVYHRPFLSFGTAQLVPPRLFVSCWPGGRYGKPDFKRAQTGLQRQKAGLARPLRPDSLPGARQQPTIHLAAKKPSRLITMRNGRRGISQDCRQDFTRYDKSSSPWPPKRSQCLCWQSTREAQ